MGGFTPIPLDPLPQPEAKPVEPKPADISQRGGFQGYPPEAGWMGKGGQTASVLSNFLSGWMAGKKMQEDKKQEEALRTVGHYQTDYQNSMMVYQTLLNSPDAKPEDKEKARQDVLRNWHELHQIQKQYLIPGSGEGAPKKKSGVKQKLKGAFGAEDPHLFAAGAIDLADKMDPTAAVGPDPRQQEATFRFNEEKKEAEKRDRYSTLLKKSMRTPDEQKELEGIEDEIYGPQAGVARIQKKEMEQRDTDLSAAREKYKNNPGSLNERERSLLEGAGELPKHDIRTPFEAYASEVGPGKRFPNYAAAADAYFKEEIKAARAERNPTMWEEMTNAGREVLKEQYAKEDADLSKPHTYRVTINGKTEERQLTDEQASAAQAQDKNIKLTKIPRTPTKGDVYGWVAERMKASPEEKEDAKHPKPQTPAQVAQTMSTVYATVIQDNPDWERFIAKQKGPSGTITMALNSFVESGPNSSVKWYESKATQRKNYQDFLKAVENEMIRRGYGGLISQVLPMNEPVAEMTPTP